MTKMKNANIRHYAEQIVKGNKDKTTKDTVVKILKVLYYLVAIGAILTCLTNMIGSYVLMLEYEGVNTADGQGLYNECRTYLITMIVCVFALVANFFLLRYKLCIPFMLIGCVECVVIFTTFYSASNLNTFNTGASGAFWALAIPSMLVALVSVILGLMIFVTYRLQIPKIYDKITSELYKVHSKDGEVKLSLEDFDKIMDEYRGEELFPTDRPLKKSQRRRKEKQDLEMAQSKLEESEE
ncbi:MAG: hypothetical protein J6Q76_06250 [Clostridia bacterium]|nr:hypothetical protein [Clostridia bacterium]